MIQFAIEAWQDVEAEFKKLWPRHYDEIIRDDDYDPDFEQYQKLSLAGVLHITTARKDGEMIGYAVALIQPHIHSKHVLWGVYDGYYLLPEHRAPGVFGRMMAFSEQDMREHGVTRLYATEPRSLSSASTWFEHNNWRFAERVFVKELR